MNDTDELQIKIEEAKRELSKETLDAISAVPWQAAILKMRETKGYTFEQLGDLEIETELLLAGLLAPEEYPRELQKSMQISEVQANELVKEMNKEVFSKIKEELIKNMERKTMPQGGETKPKEGSGQNLIKDEKEVLSSAGIEILPPHPAASFGTGENDKPDALRQETPHPILTQKLAGPVLTSTVKTEHTPDNITKATPFVSYPKNADPYRLPPE